MAVTLLLLSNFPRIFRSSARKKQRPNRYSIRNFLDPVESTGNWSLTLILYTVHSTLRFFRISVNLAEGDCDLDCSTLRRFYDSHVMYSEPLATGPFRYTEGLAQAGK